MKRFTPDTLKYMNYLSMPDLHPDGKKTVFVKTAAEENGTFVPLIYELDHLSGEVKPVAGEAAGQKRPLYSPDGKQLAYLCDKSGEYQLYLRREGVDEDILLTSLRHGISYYDWSFDGCTLVFTAPLWKNELDEKLEFKQMSPEDKKIWLEEKEWAPIEITEIDYKNDDCYGMRDGSVTRIGTIDLADYKQRLLPTGEMECAFPVFSRDGRKIAFYGKPYPGVYASNAELFVWDAKNDDIRQITKDRNLMLYWNVRPQFSKVGDTIYVNAYSVDEKGGCAETIYEVDLASGKSQLFFDQEDETVTFGINSTTIGRTVFGDEKPYFAIDYENEYLYFKNAWFGWENLYRIPLQKQSFLTEDGRKKKVRRIEAVLTGRKNVQAFCLPRNGKCIFTGGDPVTPAEVYELDLTTGQLEQKTCSNEWLKEYKLAKTEEVWVPTTDGKAKLQVWIVHPVDEEPGKQYPVVLDIHGGPECTYVSDFWHEFQAFAEAGMVCVYTNPRGSVGYGMDFSGNDYAWKKEAVEDLLLALDTATRKEFADPGRAGVTGGSYGGYMTLKMITETTSFQAAAAQRCLSNTATSYGTGDIGFLSKGREDVAGIKMLDILIERARKSLIRKVDNIKIPLLLLHGYRDYRCSFEQSEQMFIAMKERNPEVPVRLVMFPEENHGITRNGNLFNQIRHLQELTDWFCRYLKKGETIHE